MAAAATRISLKRIPCDELSRLHQSPPRPFPKSVFTLAACVREQQRKKQRLSSKLVIDLVRQLAAALRHVVARDVCHRDVQLETIEVTVVGRSMHVQLGGFDCACSLSDRDARRLPALNRGSMPCRAPELLLGAHDCAMRFATSDVWSLGCVFARLLNIEPVFTETADSEEKVITDLFCKLGTPPPSALRAICGDSDAAQGLPRHRAAPPWARIIKYKRLSTYECRLLSCMLDWNPATRAPAASLLPYLSATTGAHPSPISGPLRAAQALDLKPIAEDDVSW
jgi:serine/threonine protein kinase